MKEDNDTIITRSQRKKLEIEKAELSFDFLKCTISRSILKYLYDDVKKYGKDLQLEKYLKKIGKELKTKELELHIEYDKINPKELSENEQLYIGSVEITNEFFKEIIKDLLKNKNKKGFSVLKHLKMRMKEENQKYKIISDRLEKIHNNLKTNKKKTVKVLNDNSAFSDESDVDEKGNIKGLISYSDEEDEEHEEDQKSMKKKEKQIRDYGKYVHRLKGKDLEKFVKK